MKVNTTPVAPNTARGEAAITIGGVTHTIRFGMNVLRDFSKLTGKSPSEFGEVLGDDYTEALTAIVSCAVTRYVPAEAIPNGFSQEDAADYIDGLSQEEADKLAEAITEAVTVPPLMASLVAKVGAKTQAKPGEAQGKNGTPTSTSPSAS